MTTDLANCPDCDVRVGEIHRGGCDVTRCKATGLQLLSCYDTGPDNHWDNHGPTKWTGFWPGESFALSQGWTIPGVTDPTTGNAFPDLNKVYAEMVNGRVVWVPELEDWKLKEDAQHA